MSPPRCARTGCSPPGPPRGRERQRRKWCCRRGGSPGERTIGFCNIWGEKCYSIWEKRRRLPSLSCMFIVQYIAPRNSDLSSFFSFLGEIHGLFGPFFIFAHISPLLHPIFPASHHHHPRPHVETEEEYWGKGMFLGCASAETSTRQKWGRETTSAPCLQIITYSAVAATNA